MPINICIEEAFSSRPDIKTRTYEAIAQNASLESLFTDIAKVVQELTPGNQFQTTINSNGPASKKRKLDDSSDWNTRTIQTIKDLSFSIPQRKKLTLEIGSLETQGLRAKNLSGEVEFAIDWANIENILCLPVPEKSQAQYNFCIFPVGNSGISAPLDGETVNEQILWTVPESVPKSGILGPEINLNSEDTYKSVLLRLLNERLKPFQKVVVQPNEKEFASQMVQAYRKGEKAVHVKAFRGSKDGYLFFLPTGIAWVFKKPLIFFSFPTITTISYTSVLQRTFNLSLSIHLPTSPSPLEFEFSMIDQSDFAGIDAYIRRHRLQDASMAEQRRAKKLNINGVKEGNESGLDETEGELAKAQKEIEELEDEDEEEDENFDPGSEGESEGSGESSEEGEGLSNANYEDDDEEEDLVRKELGSEAEDIE